MTATSRSSPAGSSSCVVEDRQARTFRVARRAFVDKDILEDEQRRIFDRCWLYLGHESEIAQSNAFITRKVGGRELIFNRDRSGAVRAFFNACPHRGARVVREKQGNAIAFQCIYHGWAFNNNGNFATRFTEGSYREDMNEGGCLNLVPVPKLDHYRGLYFVNYDKSAGGLRDYLAGALEYIDLMMDQAQSGMEVVSGTQEYSIRANWKLLVENSFDGYHAATTHVTYFEYLQAANGGEVDSGPFTMKTPSRAIDLGNGHAVIEYFLPWGRPAAQWVSSWGEDGRAEVAAKKRWLLEQYGAERGNRIAHLNRNMVIFPNLVLNDIMSTTIRTFYPIAPDYMEVNGWAIAPREESAASRERRLFNFLEFLGPGGFATPDDVEALQSCQQGYTTMREAVWNDISKGMPRSQPLYDDEEQMRCFWREWQRRLSG